jgi:hypothetical protein
MRSSVLWAAACLKDAKHVRTITKGADDRFEGFSLFKRVGRRHAWRNWLVCLLAPSSLPSFCHPPEGNAADATSWHGPNMEL